MQRKKRKSARQVKYIQEKDLGLKTVSISSHEAKNLQRCVYNNGKIGFVIQKDNYSFPDLVIKPIFNECSQETISKERLYYFAYWTPYCKVVFNGKRGVINYKGEWIIPPEFDEIGDISVLTTIFEHHSKRLIPAKKEGKWGVIDQEGKWVIPPKFDELGDYQYIHRERKYNFADDKWEIYCFNEPPIIDSISRLINGEKVGIRVKIGEYYGLINDLGEWVLPAEYEFIKEESISLQESNAIINVKKDGLIGQVDLKGNWISEAYDFDEIEYDEKIGLHKVFKNGQVGLIDNHYKIKLPIEYESIEKGWYAGDTGPFFAYKNQKIAIVNMDGQIVLPLGRYKIEHFYGLDQYKPILDEDKGLWGYLNRQGNLQIPFQFNFAKDFFRPFDEEQCYAPVKNESGWGVIDADCNWILPPHYDQIHDYKGGQFDVELDGKRYIIDIWDKFTIRKDIYEDMAGGGKKFILFTEGLAPVKKNGKWGYINQDGKVIIPFMFEHCGHFYEDRAWATGPHPTYSDQLGYGYIDKTGSFVIPPTHRKPWLISMGNFENGKAMVTYQYQYSGDFTYYIIDRYGNVIETREKA